MKMGGLGPEQSCWRLLLRNDSGSEGRLLVIVGHVCNECCALSYGERLSDVDRRSGGCGVLGPIY